MRHDVPVVARHLPQDEPFFREWSRRQPGSRRSLTRASLVAEELGVDLQRLPPVALVVGSKGKGTACAWAAATLFEAGLRVVAVTSPPFRTNCERIRLDGKAISVEEYVELSKSLDVALARLPEPRGCHLAPTGAFTLAGLLYATRVGADAIVLEEGLGGRSDEISLVAARLVGATEIFAEHVGMLGSTPAEIAGDLLGVTAPGQRALLSLPQTQDVMAVLDSVSSSTRVPLRIIERGDPLVSATTPLGWLNATLGMELARELLLELPGGGESLTAARLGSEVPLRSTGARSDNHALVVPSLPGRCSFHVDDHAKRWMVDAAISPAGVRAALGCLSTFPEAPSVVACFPDVKDPRACFAELEGLDVIAVTAGEGHLSFDLPAFPGRLLPAREGLEEASRRPGPVLCIGTMSFVGEALDYLDVPTDSWW